MKLFLRTFLALAIIAFVAGGCLPKDSVQLKDIRNLTVLPSNGGDPVLSGDAVFYNPNSSRLKLKAIKVDVFVDGKKSATIDDELNIVAKAKSEFTVPLKVQLQLKEIGLVETLKNLFGGKKYQIHYSGTMKVNVNGIPFRVPVDHTEEFKLSF